MPRTPRQLLLAQLAGAILLAGPVWAGEDSTEFTAVSATVHNGYERAKEADGYFKIETYSFGEGGLIGTPTKDSSVDEQAFRKIAETIAPGLARQGYVSSFDPEKTQLLIMVYWGITGTEQSASGGSENGSVAITPPPPPPPVTMLGVAIDAGPSQPASANDSHQWTSDGMTSMRNRKRDRDNFQNARILGYEEDLAQASDRPFSLLRQDLVEEIEDPRYFVVLRAYDFQLRWKEKKTKLLWEVHYSLRARNHLFDKSLAAMTDLASHYFGENSKGLVRKKVPLGRVRLDEPVFEGYTGKTEKK